MPNTRSVKPAFQGNLARVEARNRLRNRGVKRGVLGGILGGKNDTRPVCGRWFKRKAPSRVRLSHRWGTGKKFICCSPGSPRVWPIYFDDRSPGRDPENYWSVEIPPEVDQIKKSYNGSLGDWRGVYSGFWRSKHTIVSGKWENRNREDFFFNVQYKILCKVIVGVKYCKFSWKSVDRIYKWNYTVRNIGRR